MSLTPGGVRFASSALDSVSGDMERLRVSALTRAAALSPAVREVTIGPNSPRTKRDSFNDTQSLLPPPETRQEPKAKDRVSREDKIYLENVLRYENEMAEASGAVFADMISRMMQKRAEIIDQLRIAQAEKVMREEAELRDQVQQMLKALQCNDPNMIKHLQDTEESKENSSARTIENMNRIIEEQANAGRLSAIKEAYNKVFDLCDTFNNVAQDVCDHFVVSIDNIMSNMNKIQEMYAAGSVTEKEVLEAEIFAKNAVNLKDKVNEYKKDKEFKAEQDRLTSLQFENELQLQRKNEELERAAKIITPATIENTTQDETDKATLISAQEFSKRTKPIFHSTDNYEHYLELKEFLQKYETSYKDLLSDASQKKFRFNCQKAVNVPVNSLCSVSGQHIRDKYEKLSKLLLGERVQVMDDYVCAAQHPQGVAYCMALLAKKLVNQGHLTVSSKPEASFPLGSLIITLWHQFPDLGKLIEANFHRQCPYLVPMFLPQREGQSKEFFLKSLGYLYDEDGVVEKQDKFLKRMSGIFTLQCAIWIAMPPRVMNGQNPHGLRYAWKWLASFVNLKPVSQISSTLLHDFLINCGNECLKKYNRQFIKIIHLLHSKYLKELDEIDEGGPKTRFELLVKKIIQTGVIAPPSGLLSPKAW